MASDGEERKFVTQDDLKAGVRLTAGHSVILVVEGAIEATTTGAPGGEEPEATTTAPAATTTEAPAATTTEQPATTTTAAPEEPEETTTAGEEPATTTSPSPSTSTTTLTSTTTGEPSSTTTGEPSSTTTGEPSSTTTAPSSTTTAPSTTTTGSGQASVVVELPEEALELLPDGSLTLSGDGIEDQQIAFSAAEHADEVLRFKFQWDGISVKTRLVATSGGNSVTLWEDQPAGDPSQFISWTGAVSDLYPAPAAPDTNTVESIGSAIDDLVKIILKAFP
jgi:hypothetical protein